ncbi:MAG: hypothetical protein ACE5J1_03660 [Nitrospiria bacterium]
MSSHIENEPQSALLVRQITTLIEEAFKIAEGIIDRMLDRQAITEKAVRDHYYESVPALADRICAQVTGIANMVRDGNPKEIDRLYESLEEVISQMKRIDIGK